jgi:hypothetical protein
MFAEVAVYEGLEKKAVLLGRRQISDLTVYDLRQQLESRKSSAGIYIYTNVKIAGIEHSIIRGYGYQDHIMQPSESHWLRSCLHLGGVAG